MSLCRACQEPLVIQLNDDANDETVEDAKTVPDDLELRCQCHFHWECLMEEASSVASTLKCPCCESYLATNKAGASAANQPRESSDSAVILAQYSNEGGIQRDINLMDSLTEEAYLQAHPEARPARAFHVMCSEGDIAGMIDLLRDESEQGADVGSIVRYQDPLANMKSGLHLSVEKQQEEIVWTLLWLSSTLATESFPDLVRHAAEEFGLGRLSVQANEDIRGLRDCHGRTAETIAKQDPGVLSVLLEGGALTP
ncbi:uncharacterized protein UV8b_04681 [Ustilaginoidea virens]|uniref:RING-type domain-containing protein n=1 Tax=Ustilaginoidea virens TaxID=1159556 RepID=A0A8E5HRR0_USTVR|nr:uncharacterized protein UV8b_04681 [Ustilaginoidea virens]QUC20440.1 hypothetical protein UV8b_04681 [Ustilaginoidea virens]